MIPILPSQYDIWATEDTFQVLRDARTYQEIPAYALFNQVIQNTTVVKEAALTLKDMTVENEVRLLAQSLFQRVDYKKSISEGKGVMEYAPGGKAAQEVRSLFDEICRHLETRE